MKTVYLGQVTRVHEREAPGTAVASSHPLSRPFLQNDRGAEVVAAATAVKAGFVRNLGKPVRSRVSAGNRPVPRTVDPYIRPEDEHHIQETRNRESPVSPRTKKRENKISRSGDFI